MIVIYKRSDGLFEKRVTIDGEKIMFRAQSEQEVCQKIENYKSQLSNGKTFYSVSEEWAQRHFQLITYGTMRSYQAPLNYVQEYFGERTLIKEIKPISISDYVIELVKKGYSKHTIKNYMLVLNMVFDYALLCGYISSNPYAPVKLPRNLPKSQRRTLTAEEIKIVKNSIDCTFGLFAYTLLYSGIRKGEAIALQYKDIDVNDRLIHITKSSYYKGNNAIIKCPKTECGYRDIFLLDVLADKLPNGNPNDYFFTDTDKPMSAKKFIVMWRKYLDETGLEITPHQLRHAYATILFDAGLDVKDAQDLLGHANISVTRDIYTHISKSRREVSFDKLNKFV